MAHRRGDGSEPTSQSRSAASPCCSPRARGGIVELGCYEHYKGNSRRHLTPSGRKSTHVFPCPVNSTRREPKPFRSGNFTGGPPFSCHVRHNLRWSCSTDNSHDTRTWPERLERAPYLTALGARSGRHSVRFNDVLAGIQTDVPSITKRFCCWDSNGFRARSITPRKGA